MLATRGDKFKDISPVDLIQEGLGAPDKVVQRVLRHSKPHVTKERYIKVFDRTVLEAVQKMQARIEELRPARGSRQQLELEFGDGFGLPMIAAAESTTSGSISHFSTFRPAVGQQNTLRFVEAIENRDSANEAKASLSE